MAKFGLFKIFGKKTDEYMEENHLPKKSNNNKKVKNMNGNIKTAVVGRKYYDVEVKEGEILKMVPEPDNPHDSHAVAVYNIFNQKVGYIKKTAPTWGIGAKDIKNTYCQVFKNNKAWLRVNILGDIYGYKQWTMQGGK